MNAVFGTLLAWVLTRYQFPGRRFVDALVDLPVAGPGQLQVVDSSGQALELVLDSGAKVRKLPLSLGPSGVTLFIGTDTSMVVTDGDGAQWSIELAP